ncbi:38_t:CDS:2, partial [Paraglomus brasilianum]
NKELTPLVNGIGSNKPIDKVVSQFEDIFFAESEYEFDHKEEENDLKTPGVGGRKFFDLIAENNKNTSNEIYTSTAPATTEIYGSIIKT